MTRLFNISESANIAIHSLALINASPDCVNASQISEQLNFSRNTVAKVLQALSRFNLIVSTRGPKGGFRLSRAAHEISMLEVFEIIDGKIAEHDCRTTDDLCPFNTCIYGEERHKWFSEFKDYYSKRTISDFSVKSKSNEEKHN
jgi:Rrf2 family protein